LKQNMVVGRQDKDIGTRPVLALWESDGFARSAQLPMEVHLGASAITFKVQDACQCHDPSHRRLQALRVAALLWCYGEKALHSFPRFQGDVSKRTYIIATT